MHRQRVAVLPDPHGAHQHHLAAEGLMKPVGLARPGPGQGFVQGHVGEGGPESVIDPAAFRGPAQAAGQGSRQPRNGPTSGIGHLLVSAQHPVRIHGHEQEPRGVLAHRRLEGGVDGSEPVPPFRHHPHDHRADPPEPEQPPEQGGIRTRHQGLHGPVRQGQIQSHRPGLRFREGPEQFAQVAVPQGHGLRQRLFRGLVPGQDDHLRRGSRRPSTQGKALVQQGQIHPMDPRGPGQPEAQRQAGQPAQDPSEPSHDGTPGRLG
ncbi:MAG: hypothetical protein BWY56_01670 [Acidobacteria bacterium ADurb.Bin340]|nr:MAG: hypothetical protein BWY56_01670 [Acidobacteria bacterium ADurb.Bin340]